jgi:hypothetical protein
VRAKIACAFYWRMTLSNEQREVVVVDVRIPFWSMVVLLVKWSIAAVPAILILFAIGAVVSAIFAGLFHWVPWWGQGTI